MKRLIKAYKTIVFLLITAVLIGVGYLAKKPIEAPIIIVAFLLSKQLYRRKYHCNSAVKCLCASIGVFAVAISFTFPVGISYIFAGVCGFIISFIAQKFAFYKFIRSDYEYIEPRYNAMVEEMEKFNLETCTVQQIERVCKLAHYKADKIKLAVLFFVEKKTIDEVWEYLNERKQFVERETVIKYKHRIKKDLSKFIKD